MRSEDQAGQRKRGYRGRARAREDRLLKILEKRQIRLPHLVLTVAATAAITVILTLAAVRYKDTWGPTDAARTAAVQPDLAGAAERQEP